MMSKSEYEEMKQEVGSKENIIFNPDDETTWPYQGAIVVCKMKNKPFTYKTMKLERGISLIHREKMVKGEAWNPIIFDKEGTVLPEMNTCVRKRRSEVWFKRDEQYTTKYKNPYPFIWKAVDDTATFKEDVVESYTPLHTVINSYYGVTQSLEEPVTERPFSIALLKHKLLHANIAVEPDITEKCDSFSDGEKCVVHTTIITDYSISPEQTVFNNIIKLNAVKFKFLSHGILKQIVMDDNSYIGREQKVREVNWQVNNVSKTECVETTFDVVKYSVGTKFNLVS